MFRIIINIAFVSLYLPSLVAGFNIDTTGTRTIRSPATAENDGTGGEKGDTNNGSKGGETSSGSRGGSEVKNPAFYGYGLSLSTDKPPSLKVGAPYTVDPSNPKEQLSPDYPAARGDISSCPVTFNLSSPPPPCTSSIPPNAAPGDSYGLSLNVAPDDTLTACSPTSSQSCRVQNNNPGFCYEKKKNSTTWTSDPKTKDEECNLRFLDLVFLLDASGSIGEKDFDIVKNWTKEVASHFKISDLSTRIGVVRFSYFNPNRNLSQQPFINTEIPLGSITDKVKFDKAVDEIQPTRFQTFTSHALNKTVDDFKSSDGFNQPNTAKVLILLTDGKSTDKEYLNASSRYVRNLGITTYAVGVGDADINELRLVATGTNTSDRVYYVTNFEFLNTVVDEIGTSIASVALEGSETEDTKETVFGLEHAQYGFSIAASREPSKAKIQRQWNACYVDWQPGTENQLQQSTNVKLFFGGASVAWCDNQTLKNQLH